MDGPLTAEEARLRLLGVGCLSAIGALHAVWIPHKLEEAPYMGVLFIALVAGSVAGVVLLCLAGARPAWAPWAFAGALAAAPLTGYVLSRLTALPQQEHVVGAWQDPLGQLSVGVEGFLLGLAIVCMARRTAAARRRAPTISHRGASASRTPEVSTGARLA